MENRQPLEARKDEEIDSSLEPPQGRLGNTLTF